MKSWQVHYLNKYPGGHVECSDSSLKAYNSEGKLCVAIEKGGDGGYHDRSEEYGLEGRHDLAPIPKDARVHKVSGGKISRDEEADEREELAGEFLRDGRIASCDELKKEGYQFCDKQRVLRRPVEEKVASSDAPAKKGSKKRA